jgi:hypothetical protein
VLHGTAIRSAVSVLSRALWHGESRFLRVKDVRKSEHKYRVSISTLVMQCNGLALYTDSAAARHGMLWHISTRTSCTLAVL